MVVRRKSKRLAESRDDEQTPKTRRLDNSDVDFASPQNVHGVLSPLRTPSSVTNHASFSNFSSENTLEMHTSVESSGKAISRIKSMASMNEAPADSSEEDETEQVAELLPKVVPSSKLTRQASRTRFSSFDLADDTKIDEEVSISPKKGKSKGVVEAPFDMGLAVAVSLAYASFIFCRSFFAVTQAAMKADKAIALTDAQANTIITSFGVAFGVAKFPSGILVNASPPKTALLTFMIMTSALVALASHPWCDSYTKIMVIALLNAIPQAGAYPAVTKLVCAGFEPSHHSSVFALISIGSRAGQVAVSLVLGEVLRRYNDWRVAIQVAPLVVMGAMCLVMLLTQGKTSSTQKQGEIKQKEEGEKPIVQAPLSVRLKGLLTSPRFWLVNCASSMLLISKAFDTYAVRYITDICNYLHPIPCAGVCTCKAYAPQLTAGVSLGIVTSLLFGSWVYDKLKGDGSTRSKRAFFIVVLCAMNLVIATSLYTFTVTSYASPSASYVDASEEESEKRQVHTLVVLGLLLFFLGFFSGYPFYVPQSLFAVEDASDAATVVGCGECVQSVLGAAVLITAQNYAIGEDGSTNWLTIFGAIVMAAGSALVLMMAFMYASIKKMEKSKTA